MSEPNVSERGFRNFDEVLPEDGGGFRVYESSIATGPHLLLVVRSHLQHPPLPQAPPRESVELDDASVVLSLDEAEVLRDQLDWMIKNHYQNGD